MDPVVLALALVGLLIVGVIAAPAVGRRLKRQQPPEDHGDGDGAYHATFTPADRRKATETVNAHYSREAERFPH